MHQKLPQTQVPTAGSVLSVSSEVDDPERKGQC